jgi:hypothetical protein
VVSQSGTVTDEDHTPMYYFFYQDHIQRGTAL